MKAGSLLEYGQTRFDPTGDQIKLLSALDDFFDSDKRVFLLKGYAGTGKTYMMKCIADYLQQKKLLPILIAPTGRAARIIESKTGHKASTIHKAIYNLKEVDEVKTISNWKEKYKFRYALNHILDNITRIYLVDESSMISDKYAEDDFFIFGSGRLLKDMMEFIAISNVSRSTRIIFVGDDAQLPPVGDNSSGALSLDYLSRSYNTIPSEYTLTEVVRQKKESGILANATYLRTLLLNRNRNSFELNTQYEDIKILSTEEVVSTFITANEDLDLSKAIVINHSNQAALDYNLSIRKSLFPGHTDIQVRDVLMINQNNYNYVVELLNGTMVKVKDVNPVPEIKSGMKSYDENGTDCEVTHKFRRVTIEVPTENGNVDVSCFILDSFITSPNPTLDYAENIALYIDFKIRHPHLKPKTKEFGDALRKDPYFNALRVKFGYAVTCHKAQGGEWDSVIVNLDVSQSKLSDNFLRWTYTAITRAKKQLYLFNVPKANQFTTLNYSPNQLSKTAKVVNPTEVHVFVLPSDFNEMLDRLNLKMADQVLKDKLIELLARLENSGIVILERKGHQYQEIYVFKKGEKRTSITFWYDSKMRFTKHIKTAGVTGDDDLYNEIKAIIDQPFSFHLITEEISNSTKIDAGNGINCIIDFAKDIKDLEVLYIELERLLNTHNATIADIKHNKFQEQYRIKRGSESALITFYYDSRNRFTTAYPHIPECNSNELLDDIALAIAQLKQI